MKINSPRVVKVFGFLGLAFVLVALAYFSLGTPAWRWYYLSRRDNRIRVATKQIETAPDDAARAQLYDERARAYGEKARFSTAFKLGEPADNQRMFVLSLLDHLRAIQLAPQNGLYHFSRGLTYYSRASVEPGASSNQEIFALAEVDFTRAIELNKSDARFWDMRGLARQANENLDGAIADFIEQQKLDPKLGASRLADAYCLRGAARQKAFWTEGAIADYELSIAASKDREGCSCDPFAPLKALKASAESSSRGQ